MLGDTHTHTQGDILSPSSVIILACLAPKTPVLVLALRPPATSWAVLPFFLFCLVSVRRLDQEIERDVDAQNRVAAGSTVA